MPVLCKAVNGTFSICSSSSSWLVCKICCTICIAKYVLQWIWALVCKKMNDVQCAVWVGVQKGNTYLEILCSAMCNVGGCNVQYGWLCKRASNYPLGHTDHSTTIQLTSLHCEAVGQSIVFCNCMIDEQSTQCFLCSKIFEQFSQFFRGIQRQTFVVRTFTAVKCRIPF